jgi:hypothetical protein
MYECFRTSISILYQIDLIFVLGSGGNSIANAYADVVIKDFHLGDCSEKMFVTFTTSVKFMSSLVVM